MITTDDSPSIGFLVGTSALKRTLKNRISDWDAALVWGSTSLDPS